MYQKALKLCLVTNMQNKSFDVYRSLVLKAVQGGITSVQLREKTQDLNVLHDLALDLKKLLKPFQIPLIINDHVELAKRVDAEGVHIGQSDIGPDEARKILGPNKIIGWSVETMDEVLLANQLNSIDYIAASAVFVSKTKTQCKTYWGLDGLAQVVAASRFPVMGIGGITIQNVHAVMQTGVCGVAVIGAVHDHPSPTCAASELIQAIDASLNHRETICLKI